MVAHWQTEKDAITRDPGRQGAARAVAKLDAERAERDGDLERAAQLRYGHIPVLEREVDRAERRGSTTCSTTARC